MWVVLLRSSQEGVQEGGLVLQGVGHVGGRGGPLGGVADVALEGRNLLRLLLHLLGQPEMRFLLRE